VLRDSLTAERVQYPPAPDGFTIYVVGDVHGRLDLLTEVHRRIETDKKRSRPKQSVEIYLGDYIDRGPDPAGVVACLIERARNAHAVFLRGNHEQYLLDFLNGEDCLKWWRRLGGTTTMLSYGVEGDLLSRSVADEDVRERFAALLPSEHRRFLEHTRLYKQIGPYVAVHAGMRPGVRLEDQRADDLLSIRGDFLGHDREFGFVIVHGHTPVAEPDMRSNRINIDTGAFATNRLTCLRIGQDGARVLEEVPNHRSDVEDERSSQRERSTSHVWVGSESDPVAVLGVGHNATPREIRAAHLRLAKELHPDARSQTPFADERLKAVNRAYQDLKNLNRPPTERKSRTGSFARRYAVFGAGFLTSVALVLALFGSLYHSGLFRLDDATPVAAQRPPQRVTDLGKLAAQSADPAALTVADAAAWTKVEQVGTSEALNRYLERFASGRHASQARAHLAVVATTQAALRAAPDGRDKAAIAEARTALRRYLDIYPRGQFVAEVRAKLAATDAAEAIVLGDEAAWSQAQRLGTRAYLGAHPEGLKQTEARTALAGIEAAETKQRADDAAWRLAMAARTEEALRNYLSSHPDGSNARAALEMLAAATAAEEERGRDDAAWSKAQQHNTRAALSSYIAVHPKGRHVENARARLASLRAGEAKTPPLNGITATKPAAPTNGKGDSPAERRWPSADKPFVGADGRIR
jgi:serine/threonine protein phosphatase 1